jgi:GDPmannose 4,6-dehydratase
VRDFLDEAARLLAIDWQEFVAIDERYLRPTEVDLLMGDASKAKQKLGWQARTSFEELVRVMLKADLELQGIADRYPL